MAVSTGCGRCPPAVSQVTSVHRSVPGCPSVGLVCSCSPHICKRGWRWGQSPAGPAQLREAAQVGHRQEGDPFPCQAAGIHERKRLLGFFVLNPAAGAQKMGIMLLWGNLRGVWTSIQKTPCHKPGSKGKSSRFCLSQGLSMRTLYPLLWQPCPRRIMVKIIISVGKAL